MSATATPSASKETAGDIEPNLPDSKDAELQDIQPLGVPDGGLEAWLVVLGVFVALYIY